MSNDDLLFASGCFELEWLLSVVESSSSFCCQSGCGPVEGERTVSVTHEDHKRLAFKHNTFIRKPVEDGQCGPNEATLEDHGLDDVVDCVDKWCKDSCAFVDKGSSMVLVLSLIHI